MKSFSELPAEGAVPSKANEWCDKAAKRIQKQPVQSVLRAALAGYALQYIPVRRILSGAMRLVVPGIFLAGLYQVTKSLPPVALKERE